MSAVVHWVTVESMHVSLFAKPEFVVSKHLMKPKKLNVSQTSKAHIL